MSTRLDVAIVGGGPAGLSASIFLGRYLHSVVCIDNGDPRNWETRGVNAYLGLPRVKPAQLRYAGREEARRYGVTFVDDCVDSVDVRSEEEFALTTHSGDVYVARRLLLAIGLKDVWPDIPGLERAYGETAHVCPDCDGYETRGCKTVVIGKGRKAVGMALNLTTWTNDIVICTNGEPADLDEVEYCTRLDTLNIPVLEQRVLRVRVQDRRVLYLEMEDGMELDVEKIFFAIGQYPSDDLGAQLGCERDEGGHIVVDDHYHTSVRNVFAAGDIVPGSQLAVAAAADGAIAALAIHKSLVPESRKLTSGKSGRVSALR